MIDVIVPVYNVQAYLSNCIDSILKQSYGDLELLLIDDGSDDGSGAICDSFAEQDSRVHVIHTENRGVAATRNRGLEWAMAGPAEYIIFVDGDDWLEVNMLEVLLRKAQDQRADVVFCGITFERKNRSTPLSLTKEVYSIREALISVIDGPISSRLMNKLWKKELFNGIFFPEGRTYEDIAVTYKCLLHARRMETVAAPLYHYRLRNSSIVHGTSMKNLTDAWISTHERWSFFNDHDEYRQDTEFQKTLLKRIAWRLTFIWRQVLLCDKEDREVYRPQLREMACFAQKHLPVWGRGMTFAQRVRNFLLHYDSWLSFAIIRMGRKRNEEPEDLFP
ncbi:MAG: glycosyltransferase [Lachnospiraceae bacterium]|nr:glycosyltransferase [Lachnospiraceae bacterium]